MDDQPEQPPEPRSPVRLGGIGDLSVRVGCDVRELILDGYTWDEIHDVAAGQLTLEELLRRGPTRRRPAPWWRFWSARKR